MTRRLTAALTLLVLLAGLCVARPALAGEPAPDDASARAEQLIQNLGSDDFRVREKASRDLAAMGEAARPILEKAMKESGSLEVRWRSEQLLRRLEQQGERRIDDGTDEPMGPGAADDDEPKGPPAPGADPRADSLRRYRQMEQAYEELKKRLEKDFGSEPFGFFPFPRGFPGRGGAAEAGRGLGLLFGPRRVEAPGLTLEVFPDRGVALHVRREDDAGVTTEEVFKGKSLDDVLSKHPELADHPGMAQLKKRAAVETQDPFEAFGLGGVFPGGSGGISGTVITTTGNSSVEIRQTPGHVVVTLRERPKDGPEKVTTVEGESLEQIKKDHPEIAPRLQGLELSFGPSRLPSPRIFRERRRPEGLEPMPEEQPERPATPELPAQVAPRFGIEFSPVDEVLATHLGIAQGGGLLVGAVVPGSQAEEMGVLRHDVLLSVNGTPATETEAVVSLLRSAARDKSGLRIELVRAGQRKSLTR